ncbi:MAG: hypothetical protein KJO69_02150 [Gammaproteobacteria bacterium]|nr:hypothetical protein [Gammaproteobacteria bacterium]
MSGYNPVFSEGVEDLHGEPAANIILSDSLVKSSVGFGEGGALTISTTDNNTTESAVIETDGTSIHIWTTNACQLNIGDTVTAGDNDYMLLPNTLYEFAFQSGWRISVRADGTSGGNVYYHPVGG